MDQERMDRQDIRALIENWAVWRDAGDWERFRTVWHDDGVMMATWFQGPADEFIRVTQEGWAKGVSILHFLGGSSIDVAGDRADRADEDDDLAAWEVEGVLCDVVCTGRFYDFIERRDGRWGIVLRQPIYEKDRIDPVDPAAQLDARSGGARAIPEGYRHLAYIQTRHRLHGQARHAPAHRARGRALYARGAAWLAAASLQGSLCTSSKTT